MENEWLAIAAYGALQFTGTCIRRFNAIVGTPEGPHGWTPRMIAGLRVLGLVTLLAVLGIFIRAGIMIGWGSAVILFLLGLVASLVLEFILIQISSRVFRRGPWTFQIRIALAGVVVVPLLFLTLWLLVDN
jgi:hypothetical protein